MAWSSGDRVIVRGADWRVIRSTAFSDCEALDLVNEHSALPRTLLLPFDRPRSPSLPRLQVVSRKRWAREVSSFLRGSHPYGALQFCPPSIHLLPYQLEPALAILRHGALRMLIADDVGLGKTVEAGLIIREIAMRHRLSRILILTPASVRSQWGQELAALFSITAVDADAAWLRRFTSELPPDVNPWSLPGVYLASVDFVKRAEALRPLEDVRWDLLVVDEAHVASPGSDRRAAVHALACRSRLLVLLTATPHSGDDEQFSALCGIGAERQSAPIAFFSRARADTPLGENQPRSCLLAVRQTGAEQRTHRLLEEYTARIWVESRIKADAKGELVATILRKRALSSPASLALSIRRRIELLGAPASVPVQLGLPLEENGYVEEDNAPDSSLAGAELTDGDGERHLLRTLAEHADLAAQQDSKLRALMRLLRRVREAAIVFTEYRDTAEHLSRALAAGEHRVCVLHGGLSPSERAAVIAAFRSGGWILIATDAAAEGLNLQHACRLVVHFELPWTPSRLHQRRGRVNRIGQTRRVHEIVLVANDTCEQLVLVPLLQRAVRSRAFARTPLVDLFTESRVAAHVLGGAPVAEGMSSSDPGSVRLQRYDLRDEAREEATRLAELRRLKGRHLPSGINPERRAIVPIARTGKRWLELGRDLILVVGVSLRDQRGTRFDEHPLVVSIDLGGFAWHARRVVLRQQVERVLASLRPHLAPVVHRVVEARVSAVAPIRAEAIRTIRTRDAELQCQLRSTARDLVQSGLFDRRAMRWTAARDRQREILLDDLSARATALDDHEARIEGTYEIQAILVGAGV